MTFIFCIGVLLTLIGMAKQLVKWILGIGDVENQLESVEEELAAVREELARRREPENP